MNELLRCAGVHHRYGALPVLTGIDLTVVPGARHALIGPNGAGKSTLLKLIAGAMRPSAGRIHYAGNDVTRHREGRRARAGIGRTFQHSTLFGSLTVRQNVALGLGAGRAGRRHREAIDALLASVGLQDLPEVPVATLSYSQCRRLEIAVALAARPRLLLLDEPAAGMSGEERARLVDLLRGLPPTVTVVFVEHDLDVVFQLATEVSVLHLGTILVTGSPDEVRRSPEVRDAYLGARTVEVSRAADA
ncbi:ABC transporter ATP-binding protein [Actinoplanes teichomyceticus]|uniref:Branched-chain amino acid transport system ATP-binding protein n=1 Tax=Actinoplanes teichomyceticus TaxID=1867 RepID=A0A561WBP2_ACTTI|nr:ATP-binding cassette domain-containing protein [Actinoplanes teichomyceticus]TWG21286.1 branched-chain amino acid transport system ATP-binding protein [Actinoplanes teichomyceticus]GIF16701.1 ABC transporter ATP-binding protein [Actinoplanes teichomyceticus]